ncbi:MAG: exosortase C-terminal domain/associated protein EpsI [Candidatus Brocadiia bacterium]
MKRLRTRYFVAMGAMALLAPLALYLQYDVPPPASVEPLRAAIPRVIDGWTMVDERGPTEDEKRILETDAILTRTYRRSGGGETARADLSVVFAKDNRRVAHPPEICYKGSGWSIESKSLVHFPVRGQPFEANRLLLVRGGHRLLVLYWYRAGPAYTANYLRMQWLIVKSHLLSRASNSALVRVSALSPAAEEDDEVTALLKDFAAVAIPEVTAAFQ